MIRTRSTLAVNVTATLALLGVVIACSAWGYRAWVARQALNDRLAAVIEWDNTREIRSLVRRGADPRTRPPSGRTVLMVAANVGDLDLMRDALSWGVDPNLADQNGVTALHFAARPTAKPAGLDLLIQNGADPNPSDNRGMTALHSAALSGDTRTMGRLANGGANLDPAGKDGMTPLMIAVAAGKLVGVQHLLDAGADLSCRAEDARTALDLARDRQQDIVKARRVFAKKGLPLLTLSGAREEQITRELKRERR